MHPEDTIMSLIIGVLSGVTVAVAFKLMGL
jgi:hypothetical protein